MNYDEDGERFGHRDAKKLLLFRSGIPYRGAGSQGCREMVPGVPPTIGYDRISSQTFDDSHLRWVIKSIVFTP